MRELADKLAEIRAGVAQLERTAAIATCREVECDIRRAGGRNAAGGVSQVLFRARQRLCPVRR